MAMMNKTTSNTEGEPAKQRHKLRRQFGFSNQNGQVAQYTELSCDHDWSPPFIAKIHE
jgi:hypothetical protein